MDMEIFWLCFRFLFLLFNTESKSFYIQWKESSESTILSYQNISLAGSISANFTQKHSTHAVSPVFPVCFATLHLTLSEA